MLHGEIKVNDYEIARWTAVRKERILGTPQPHEDNNMVHRYECHVDYTDIGGYKWVADFSVNHDYRAGALELAAKVMRGYRKHGRSKMTDYEVTETFFGSRISGS